MASTKDFRAQIAESGEVAQPPNEGLNLPNPPCTADNAGHAIAEPAEKVKPPSSSSLVQDFKEHLMKPNVNMLGDGGLNQQPVPEAATFSSPSSENDNPGGKKQHARSEEPQFQTFPGSNLGTLPSGELGTGYEADSEASV